MIHALVLFLAMQASTAQSADQHQAAGVTALKAGQVNDAMAEFKKVIELDPTNAPGYFGLGIAFMQTGDYGNAIPRLKKALELDPNLTVVHKPLGYALLGRGYASEAVPQFEKAGDKAGLGIAQLETGDLTNAVENLQSAAKSSPNDPDVMYYLARASGLLSKQMYDLLLLAHPNSARANLAEAENYAALRQGEEAEAHYKAALKQNPTLLGAHLALGQFYATSTRWKEAEDQFRIAAKQEPGNAEAAYRLGAALLQDGNAHDASVELERANRLLPDMPETLEALGKAESMLDNVAAAEKAWKRVIELENTGPLASQAHFGLAGIYRKQGKAEDAAREMKLFQEAKQTAPQAQ
jgi:tetratricopeptide (TPR) repeat protein